MGGAVVHVMEVVEQFCGVGSFLPLLSIKLRLLGLSVSSHRAFSLCPHLEFFDGFQCFFNLGFLSTVSICGTMLASQSCI